ncbi:hypothetical protein J1N35_033629, partial [Gossypium stocksii]
MDPSFSSVIQGWKPRLGAFTRIMGRSWICPVNGSKDYDIWRKRRVNSQQISLTSYTFQNPFLEEMPSELEITRHEFECEKAKLLRDISSLQEENYQLKINIQIEESKTRKAQKEAEIWFGQIVSRMEGKTEQHQRWDGILERESEKEEEKAARAVIELRKKNLVYETVLELITSKSKHQELRGKVRDLENILQAHQQQLDNLLKALEEKN